MKPGPSLAEREAAHFFHTYKRLPVEIERGDGVYLYGTDGTRYLDMFAGLAVNALGYAHPRILRAVREQSERYLHLSNYYLQQPQIRLAEFLTGFSGYPRIFFTNSGTESIEGAVKIARRWGSTRGKSQLISFTNAFHGRTMGALSMMDREKYREGFGPFLPDCRIVEFNDTAALRGAVSEKSAAVIIECVQGEGGIRPVNPEFAATLKSLSSRFGFLLIADEIQSGIGRTGKFFAFEHFDLHPDVVVVAKPIGGGLPLGAILGGAAVADVLEPGTHGTTFGGNPVACAAGIAVLEEIQEQGLMKQAGTLGALFRSGLQTLAGEFPKLIREVRGIGLMLGVELTRDGEPIVAAMREGKILINCTDRTVLRFLPPLIITKEHVELTLTQLRISLQALR